MFSRNGIKDFTSGGISKKDKSNVVVNTYNDLPNPGEEFKLYETKDEHKFYRWSADTQSYHRVDTPENYDMIAVFNDNIVVTNPLIRVVLEPTITIQVNGANANITASSSGRLDRIEEREFYYNGVKISYNAITIIDNKTVDIDTTDFLLNNTIYKDDKIGVN